MKLITKHTFFSGACFAAMLLGSSACKDQLDVGNPNAPTVVANVNNETGIYTLAQGAVYVNGFAGYNGNNQDSWLGDSYFSLPLGYQELLADHVGADASNNQVTTIAQPDYIVLDNGTKITNSSPQIGIIRAYNNRAATGNANNAIYYQWLNMYSLNNSCNNVLALIDGIKFSGDAASRANTVKAWCYWWKGYAYASIGSMYYSGLINDVADVKSSTSVTNGNYVLHDAIIAQSNNYFNQAATTLGSITSATDYQAALKALIPATNQVGHGGVPTADVWKRNINTMLARNIIANKLAPFVNGNPDAKITKSSTTAMTTADWNNVLTLATNGIKNGDIVFTGRSTDKNSFFSATGGTVAALTTGVNNSTTFKISERFIQNFNPGDKRFTNNFSTENTYKNNYIYTTRYNVIDGGAGMAGVAVFGTTAVGAYEVYIAGSYEENALMLAEANLRLGNIEAGLGYIDAVRTYQGAGVAAVAGTGLNLSKALTELTKERQVALFGRGVAYYDVRRWGWIYDIANGGGSYGNTVQYVDPTSGAVIQNTKVTINYNFLDYWDVPADETVLNPSTSGVATKNPNF